MSTTIFFPALKRVLFLLLLNLAFTNAHAQKLNQLLQDAGGLLKKGSDAVKQVGGLATTAKETTSELNSSVKDLKNSVKVIKGSASEMVGIPDGTANKPKFKRGKFTNFKWEPVSQFDGQVFPAMIISMVTYKGDVEDETMNSFKSSALGFYFRGDQSFIPVKWEIESADKSYFDKVGGNFVMHEAKQDYYFMPNVPWNRSTLASHQSRSPITIIYRLYDEAGNKEERSETLYMRSVDDCVISISKNLSIFSTPLLYRNSIPKQIR